MIDRSRAQRVRRVCELRHIAKFRQIADLDVILLLLDHLLNFIVRKIVEIMEENGKFKFFYLLLVRISARSRAHWSSLNMEVLRKRYLWMVLEVVRADKMNGSNIRMRWDLDSWRVCGNILVHVVSHHFCLFRRFVSHDSVD